MESREKESGVVLDRFKCVVVCAPEKETFIKSIIGFYSLFPFLSPQHYSSCVASLLFTTIRAMWKPIANVPCISLKSTSPLDLTDLVAYNSL